MMNNSFDYSTVTYASSKSRITVKTKKKLDELAAQVAIWNKDSFNKKRKSIFIDKIMDVSSIRSKFSAKEENKRFSTSKTKENLETTPIKSNEQRDKIMLTNLSSVKKNSAFFESLASQQQTETFKKINYTPHSKTKNTVPFRPLINNARIANEKMPCQLSVTKDVKIDQKRSPSNDQSFIDKENVCPDSDVKNDQKRSPSNDQSFIDKENVCPDSDIECTLPPPPPSDGYASDNIEDSLNPASSVGTDSSDSEEFTEVSSVDNTNIDKSPADRTLSMLEDIYNELSKRNYLAETISLDMIVQSPMKEATSKNVRRSLSWNENISYLEPESDDSTSVEARNMSENEDYTSTEVEEEVALDQSNCDDLSSPTNDSLLSYVEFDRISTNAREKDPSERDGALVMKIISEQNKAANELQMLLLDPTLRLGSEEHTAASLKVIESSLRRQSIAEKMDSFDGGIEANLTMNNIKLGLKDNFVLIDYNSLEATNRGQNLDDLKSLHHIVMFVRCRGDHRIERSHVYTIVPKTEAQRLGLPHDQIQRLNIFEYVKFRNLRPEFLFNFELYCMSMTPRKYAKAKKDMAKYTPFKNSPIKFTPLKKLLGRSTPVEGAAPGRSMLFTNIGSFAVTAARMGTKNQRTGLRLDLSSNVPLTGEVSYEAAFAMDLVDACPVRLNVYSEVGAVGNWAFYECRLRKTGLCGWRVSEHLDTALLDEPDFELPFSMCLSRADFCSYAVCAKSYTLSVAIDKDTHIACSSTPINRRMSSDGRRKYRFLASADSYDEAFEWCANFNEAHDSFVRWTQSINGP